MYVIRGFRLIHIVSFYLFTKSNIFSTIFGKGYSFSVITIGIWINCIGVRISIFFGLELVYLTFLILWHFFPYLYVHILSYIGLKYSCLGSGRPLSIVICSAFIWSLMLSIFFYRGIMLFFRCCKISLRFILFKF